MFTMQIVIFIKFVPSFVKMFMARLNISVTVDNRADYRTCCGIMALLLSK